MATKDRPGPDLVPELGAPTPFVVGECVNIYQVPVFLPELREAAAFVRAAARAKRGLPPDAPQHTLTWRGPVPLERLAVAACVGLAIADEWLTDRPEAVTCRSCRAIAVLRDLDRMLGPYASARALLDELDAELVTPVPPEDTGR